ncbi:MAG TPA: hypothetical protein VG796_09415 [Verrucomicrobiales bacterium]|jgi:hypothetical protein|nr:hypothetical protein [Verrucomicrobiales bacterium]
MKTSSASLKEKRKLLRLSSLSGMGEDGELKLKQAGVYFVGAVSMTLTIGGLVFSILNPSECWHFWIGVSPVLTTALTLLIVRAFPAKAALKINADSSVGLIARPPQKRRKKSGSPKAAI